MRIEELKELSINQVDDWVTMTDLPDQAPNFAIELRGAKNVVDGAIFERDNGSKHLFAAYPSKPSATSMIDFTYLKDNSTGLDYPIVAALDTSNSNHLYVNDTDNDIVGDADGWIEVTRGVTAYVKSVSTTTVTIAADVGGTIQGVLDAFGATIQVGTNELKWYVVKNTTLTNYATVISSIASVVSTTFATITLNKDASATILNWVAGNAITLYRHSAILTVPYNAAAGTDPHIRWDPIESKKKVNFYYGTHTAGSATPPTVLKPFRIIKKASTAYFSGAAASPTLAQIWHLEQGGGGLITDYQTDGTQAAPSAAGTVLTTIGDGNGNNWLQINRVGTDVDTTAGYAVAQIIFGVPVNGDMFRMAYFQGVGTVSMDLTKGAVYNLGTKTYTTADEIVTIMNTHFSVWGSSKFNAVNAAGTITITAMVTGSAYNVSLLYILAGAIGTLQISNVSQGATSTAGSTRYFEGGIDAGTGALTYYHSVIATVEYDGYQESDAIYRLYYAAAANKWGSLVFSIYVNFELMPKNITAITFYEAKTTTADSTAGFANWSPANTDFKKIYSAALTGTPDESLLWSNITTTDSSTAYFYRFTLPTFTQSYVENKFNSAPESLSTNLQHANQIVRSFYTPRYAAKTSRSGDSVVVIDKSDTLLLISSLDGASVSEDDNFPDVEIDSAGRTQRIPLFSNGEMMGLQILNDTIVVFRRGEAETYDLQSGLRNIFPIDCVSKRSILLTPYGIIFAGQAGIYLMASDGSGVRLLNPKWKNYYDGSYFLDGTTTPYLTSTMRQGIVSGYSPQYHLGLFHITAVNKSGGTESLCYIYNFEKDKWFIRQFNIGTNAAITAFGTRIDNSFVIQYSAGLLNYPDTSSLPWEDDVTSAGVSASKGIPCKLLINIGNLYNLIQNASIQEIIVDCDSTIKELAGTGTVTIANGSAAIVGSASNFLLEAFLGWTIIVSGQTQRKIIAIADDTHLTTNSPFGASTGGLSFTISKPYSHNLDFFANDQTTSFDAKTQRLGMKSSPRKLAPIGVLERLKIQIATPSTNLYYLQQYLIRKIVLLYSESTRVGNN